jgi:c-di-GMP-binding flagellar brake protein YcgR
MGEENEDILADAVARNSAAVLSLPSAGMLRHHKSRFLAQTPEGIWIESARGETPLIDELMQQKTAVGVSFKAAPNKANFASTILRRDSSYQLNAAAVVEALLLETPAKIKPVQRRNNYRVRVPDGAGLSMRVWKIAEHAQLRDRPLASQLVSITVRDLSVGGMGVIVQLNTDKQAVRSGQRLRLEVKWQEVELILEAVLRMPTPQPSAESIRGGVQFKKLENNLAGRQALAALTRIVGEFQREEVRNSRLGLNQPPKPQNLPNRNEVG